MSPSLPLLVPLLSLLTLISLSSTTPLPSPRLQPWPRPPKAKQPLTLVDVSYSTVTRPATKVVPVLVVNAATSNSLGGTATPLPDRTFIRWEPVTDIDPTLYTTALHFGQIGAHSRRAQQANDQTYMWYWPKWFLEELYTPEPAPAPTEVIIHDNPAGQAGLVGLVHDSAYFVEASPTSVPPLATRVEHLESLLVTAAPVPIVVVTPVMTPPPQLIYPEEEPEVFWREVKKVVPITARVGPPRPQRSQRPVLPQRKGISRRPLKDHFFRVLRIPQRKQYREQLLRRAESEVVLVPVSNGTSVPTLNDHSHSLRKGFRELVSNIAMVVGYILLALLVGFAIVAVFFACCSPMFRYIVYGKKAVHAYRAYKAHKAERARAKEMKEARKLGITPVYPDVRRPDRAHISKEKGSAPEVHDIQDNGSWSSWRPSILYHRNPRINRMMFPSSWNISPNSYEERNNFEPHLTPSSDSKSSTLISTHEKGVFRHSVGSPPPLPPRPVYRISTPSSMYERPSSVVYDDGIGDILIRLWKQLETGSNGT